jgi:hypothetical protein
MIPNAIRVRNKVNELVITPVGDEETERAVRCVNRHVPGAEAYDVLEMLGLPPVLVTVKPSDGSGRRAAPDAYRRTRKAGGRHG